MSFTVAVGVQLPTTDYSFKCLFILNSFNITIVASVEKDFVGIKLEIYSLHSKFILNIIIDRSK